jgi:hypothetical protein
MAQKRVIFDPFLTLFGPKNGLFLAQKWVIFGPKNRPNRAILAQKQGPKMTPFLGSKNDPFFDPFLDPYFDPQNPGFGTLPVPPTSPMYYKGEPHIRGLRTPGPLMQYKGNPWIWGPGTPDPQIHGFPL